MIQVKSKTKWRNTNKYIMIKIKIKKNVMLIFVPMVNWRLCQVEK